MFAAFERGEVGDGVGTCRILLAETTVYIFLKGSRTIAATRTEDEEEEARGRTLGGSAENVLKKSAVGGTWGPEPTENENSGINRSVGFGGSNMLRTQHGQVSASSARKSATEGEKGGGRGVRTIFRRAVGLVQGRLIVFKSEGRLSVVKVADASQLHLGADQTRLVRSPTWRLECCGCGGRDGKGNWEAGKCVGPLNSSLPPPGEISSTELTGVLGPANHVCGGDHLETFIDIV